VRGWFVFCVRDAFLIACLVNCMGGIGLMDVKVGAWILRLVTWRGSCCQLAPWASWGWCVSFLG